MRHGKKINHLGRKSAHRKAMLMNMANSLIEHKRLETTTAKAKALQRFVEPIINKAKTDSTHSRRMAFRYLKNKYAVDTLFTEVANKIGDRNGGFTRVIKTTFRAGDNADMAIIELVDYNENLLKTEAPKKKRSRRSKSTAKPAATETTEEVVETPAEEPKAEAATEAPAVEEKAEETPEAKAEDKKEESKEDNSEEGIDISDIDLEAQDKKTLVEIANSLEIKTKGLNAKQIIEKIKASK